MFIKGIGPRVSSWGWRQYILAGFWLIFDVNEHPFVADIWSEHLVTSLIHYCMIFYATNKSVFTSFVLQTIPKRCYFWCGSSVQCMGSLVDVSLCHLLVDVSLCHLNRGCGLQNDVRIEQMDTRKLSPTTSCTNCSLLLGTLVSHQDWKCIYMHIHAHTRECQWPKSWCSRDLVNEKPGIPEATGKYVFQCIKNIASLGLSLNKVPKISWLIRMFAKKILPFFWCAYEFWTHQKPYLLVVYPNVSPLIWVGVVVILGMNWYTLLIVHIT